MSQLQKIITTDRYTTNKLKEMHVSTKLPINACSDKLVFFGIFLQLFSLLGILL